MADKEDGDVVAEDVEDVLVAEDEADVAMAAADVDVEIVAAILLPNPHSMAYLPTNMS